MCSISRAQLQGLAIQTVTFLCTPIPRISNSLAVYLGPKLNSIRESCLKALTARKVRAAVREAALELVATSLESQHALAERFLKLVPLSVATAAAAAAAEEKKAADAAAPSTPKAGGEQKTIRQFNDQSVLSPLMEYIAEAPALFEKQPAVLAKTLQILYSLWDAAPAYQNVTATLRQEPNFWPNVCYALTVDIKPPPLPSAAAGGSAGAADIGASPSRSNEMKDEKSGPQPTAPAAGATDELVAMNRYCQQLLIRARALQIIALELYNLSAGEDVHAPLVPLLQSFIEKGRHEKVSDSRVATRPAELLKIQTDSRLSFVCMLCSGWSNTRRAMQTCK